MFGCSKSCQFSPFQCHSCCSLSTKVQPVCTVVPPIISNALAVKASGVTSDVFKLILPIIIVAPRKVSVIALSSFIALTVSVLAVVVRVPTFPTSLSTSFIAAITFVLVAVVRVGNSPTLVSNSFIAATAVLLSSVVKVSIVPKSS